MTLKSYMFSVELCCS